MIDTKLDALIQATQCLRNNDCATAERILDANYPFIPIKSEGRNYTIKQMIAQFFS